MKLGDLLHQSSVNFYRLYINHISYLYLDPDSGFEFENITRINSLDKEYYHLFRKLE